MRLWSRVLLGLVFLQGILLAGICVKTLMLAQDISTAFFVQGKIITVLLLSQVCFETALAFVAGSHENKYALFAFGINHLESVYYMFMLMVTALVMHCGLGVMLISALIAVLQICLLIVGYKSLQEFGWKFFKLVGSNLQLKNMFATFQKLTITTNVSLVHEVRICLAHAALLLGSREIKRNRELSLGLTITLAVLIIARVILHRVGLLKENPLIFILGFVTSVCSLGISAWITLQDAGCCPDVTSILLYPALFYVFSCLLISSYYSWHAYHNFGKGLKEKVYPKLQPCCSHLEPDEAESQEHKNGNQMVLVEYSESTQNLFE
jgi:hypothetical protein